MHPSVQSIHLQIDNVVALSYLVKMGGTHNKVLSDISKLKLLWNYLLAKVITITAEYFSGTVMKEADFQARAVRETQANGSWIPRFFKQYAGSGTFQT